MRWSDLDDRLRLELLSWHAGVWKPLFDWGFEGLGDLEGKRVLEVGAGDGGLTCLMAMCGAEVFSTDLRHDRLVNAARVVRERGLERRVRLFAADIYRPPLREGAFDLVVTRSVLVLLDRAKVLPLLKGLLKPGGEALFVENLDGNPLLMAWRKLTKSQWGPYGYFTPAEVAGMSRYFSSVDVRYHGLSLVVAPRLGPLEGAATAVLGTIDRALLERFPSLNRRSWLSAMRCRT